MKTVTAVNTTKSPYLWLPWLRTGVGVLVGGLVGAAVHAAKGLSEFWQYVAIGAVIGATLGVAWRGLHFAARKVLEADWEVTEVEIDTLGQKWKLVSSDSQRRVAWSVYVELTTRIATQPMGEAHGDDGVALRSLYDLFTKTRTAIAAMEPNTRLPSRSEGLDTVETFDLGMLNQDLRPFLSKWPPRWDAWRNANPAAPSTDWDLHEEFRTELAALQSKIKARADGLATIAGVPDERRVLPAQADVTEIKPR